MKNKYVIIVILLIIIYYGSFILFSNKYIVQYTSGACDITRVVSYEWQRKIYYLAAAIEIKLFGKEPHKPSLQVHTKELQEYFREQQKLCEGKV